MMQKSSITTIEFDILDNVNIKKKIIENLLNNSILPTSELVNSLTEVIF